MITAVNIRNRIKKIYNDHYPATLAEVATASGKPFLGNITEFFDTSFAEESRKRDEFGLIWIENNNFRRLSGSPNQSILGKITFMVFAVMIERTDLTDQLAMAQEALSRCFIDNDGDLTREFDVNIESSGDLDLGQKDGHYRYMSTGIKIELERGI